MTAPESHRYESNGLSLHYSAWGDPDRPLLILHHGFLDQGRSWDTVCQTLCAHWRVLAVDARGHGDSDWIGPGGSYYFPDYVYDLRMLLLQLGDPPVRLVGHSMGGSVMAYYAGAFPAQIEGVVLIEGLGPPAEPASATPGVLRRFVETTRKRSERRTPTTIPNVEEAAKRMRAVDPLLSETVSIALARRATRAVDGGVVWAFDPMHRARMGTPFLVEIARSLWREIEAPVLSIRGEKSVFQPPDHAERLAAFRNIREVVLPEAGHNVHCHVPDRLAATIAEFLSPEGP